MTTYFDTRHHWLDAIRRAAQGNSTDLDMLCEGYSVADPLFAPQEPDFFFAGCAALWAQVPTEQTLCAIVQAIEREVRHDMNAVAAAWHVRHGEPLALGCYGTNREGDGDQWEDADDASRRIMGLCDDAHELMHAVGCAGFGDIPQRAVRLLMEPKP